MRDYEGSGLLDDRRALITGGDSGIGRALAVAFAKEGADVAISYLSEQEDGDARHTTELVAKTGHRCVTIRADLAEEANCHGLRGNKTLIDYAATKGAVLAFTYSLEIAPSYVFFAAGCPATTPARCWPRWAARRCPVRSQDGRWFASPGPACPGGR